MRKRAGNDGRSNTGDTSLAPRRAARLASPGSKYAHRRPPSRGPLAAPLDTWGDPLVVGAHHGSGTRA